MNIRKNIDYSELFAALIEAMNTQRSQMELYCEIGRLVAGRPEKGAAVAAAEFLSKRYPECSGFSPRNLRRMRSFYQQYGNDPIQMGLALSLGWTQNVTILEADLDDEARAWYLGAAKAFGWSKSEIQTAIQEEAHLRMSVQAEAIACEEEQVQNPTQEQSNKNFRFSAATITIHKIMCLIDRGRNPYTGRRRHKNKPTYRPPEDGWLHGRIVAIFDRLWYTQMEQ